MRLFGPSKQEVWRELCRQIGAEFEKGSFRRPDTVVARVEPWVVTLDTYTASAGETTVVYTRMRAPYVSRDGFRYNIRRSSLFTGLSKKLGMQDFEIGEEAFDSAFVLQGNYESKLKEFLSNNRLRELLMCQPSISFRIKDDEGRFGPKFHENVDEVYFETASVIKDVNRLKDLFDLFSVALRQLCEIGSAYELDPSGSITIPIADTLVRGSKAPLDPQSLLKPAYDLVDVHAGELPRAAE